MMDVPTRPDQDGFRSQKYDRRVKPDAHEENLFCKMLYVYALCMCIFKIHS